MAPVSGDGGAGEAVRRLRVEGSGRPSRRSGPLSERASSGFGRPGPRPEACSGRRCLGGGGLGLHSSHAAEGAASALFPHRAGKSFLGALFINIHRFGFFSKRTENLKSQPGGFALT